MPESTGAETIVPLLGDQLSTGIASLRAADRSRTIVLMAEVMEEATYVRHHKRKIAFLFSAMRHFAEALSRDGWTVAYTRLEDPDNTGTLFGELQRAVARTRPAQVIVTEPGEWRLAEEMKLWSVKLGLPVKILEDDRFIASHAEFREWAKGRRQFRMEHFYRQMRVKTGYLMDGDEPAGGQWNYDHDNRGTPPRGQRFPGPLRVQPDKITREVLALVDERFADHPGSLDGFWFAVTRKDAMKALAHFIDKSLPTFGDWQDAMLREERFLSHAAIAQYLNCGLLDAREVCDAAQAAYATRKAPLNAVEGFIRQIVGWREYVRGIYWLSMPAYAKANALGATRPLPSFYWTGETPMACVSAVVKQTMAEAYAHHIQRLMITGNFALLAGIAPPEVHEWYLAVYADAYEWVEMPNTIGMSQFADGGLMASKPYAASGNYISRMSDYCKRCTYDVKQKTGPDACPFNYLYWDFIARNRETLKHNQRLATVWSTYDRMNDEAKNAISASARRFLDSLA